MVEELVAVAAGPSTSRGSLAGVAATAAKMAAEVKLEVTVVAEGMMVKAGSILEAAEMVVEACLVAPWGAAARAESRIHKPLTKPAGNRLLVHFNLFVKFSCACRLHKSELMQK